LENQCGKVELTGFEDRLASLIAPDTPSVRLGTTEATKFF
jgi:hypothetical protein